jgi:hypothetical protein
VDTEAGAAAVQSDLATQLSSASAATTFLSAAAVSVTSAPVVVQTTQLVVVTKPPPPSIPPTPPPQGGRAAPVGGIVGGVVGGIAALLIAAALWFKCKQKSHLPLSSAPAKGVQLTSTTTPSPAKAEYQGVTSPLGSPKDKAKQATAPPPISQSSSAAGVGASSDVSPGDSASARAKFVERSKQSAAAKSPRPAGAPGAADSGRSGTDSSIGGWFQGVTSPKEGEKAVPSDRSDLSNMFKNIVGALSPKAGAPGAAGPSTAAKDQSDFV